MTVRPLTFVFSPTAAARHASSSFVGAIARDGAALVGLAGRVLDTLYLWQRRVEERYHLASLDDRALKDVGLSRADVLGESEKPFWKP